MKKNREMSNQEIEQEIVSLGDEKEKYGLGRIMNRRLRSLKNELKIRLKMGVDK